MLSGAAAIAKVVVKAEAREDNWTVQEVGQEPQVAAACFSFVFLWHGDG